MTNELSTVEEKKIVLNAQQQANLLKVENPAQAEEASGLLKQIKEYKKALTERKEEMTRPLMKGLASIRDLFKPLEADLLSAEKGVKDKLLAYQIEEQSRVEVEQAKIAKRVEKGTMRADTAAHKLGEIGEAPTVKGTQIRTLTKVRVVDETLVPREYLTPNMSLITEAVLHKNIEIPGVEKYAEKTLASV